MEEKAFWFEIHDNDFADVTKNFDDCIIRKFEDLEGEINAMMKDFKTLGWRRGGGGSEGLTLDVVETQYEDVQDKENMEDVVKPIENVVEEYVRDPKTENEEDENVKDA